MPSLDDCTQSWFKYLDEFASDVDADVIGSDLKKRLQNNVENMFSEIDEVFNRTHDDMVDILDELELIEEYELQERLYKIVENIVKERGK